MISNRFFVESIFKRAWATCNFLHTVKYFHVYQIRIILFTINHLFAHSLIFSSIVMYL